MVRRGWQQLDVPTGWVPILCGLRSKAEKWPAASAKVQETPSSGGRAVVTSCIERPACRERPFESRQGVDSRTIKGVSPRDSVGSVGGVRFRRRPQIARRFEAGTVISAGTANFAQIQDLREVNAQDSSFGTETQRRGPIAGECKGPFGKVAFFSSISFSSLRVGYAQVAELKAKMVLAEAERDARQGTMHRGNAKRMWTIPRRIEFPSGRVVGKTSFHIATRKCKSGWRTDRRIYKR